MDKVARIAMAVALIGVLGAFRPCAAGPVTAVFSLGAPNVSGNLVEFDVSLEFGADPGVELVFFGIDVSPSSPELTGGGTDFSAFAFVPSSPLLDDWDLVIDFDDSPVAPGTVQYDTILAPLAPGTYSLGTLVLDLSIAGVPLDPALFVSIEGSNTEIGAEGPNDPFDFYPGTFRDGRRNLTPAVVPEPATWLLAGIGTLGLFGSRPRRRP